jgi:hypothetical protein
VRQQMFEINQYYRHTSTLDIDIFVLDVLAKSEDEVTLSVAYWNRHYNMMQGRIEHVTINSSDYHLWKRI